MDDKYLLTNLLYRMTMWDEHEANNSDSKLAVKYWKKHIHQRKEPEEEQKIYQLLLKSLDDAEFDYKSITPIFNLSNNQIRNYLKRIEPEITAYVTGPELLCDKIERVHASLFEPTDKALFAWFLAGWILTTKQLPNKYGALEEEVRTAINAMLNETASIKQLKLIANISDRNIHSYSLLPFEISKRELKNVPFAKEKRLRRIKKLALEMIESQRSMG